MTEQPLFSVLTATHNHAPYLAEALVGPTLIGAQGRVFLCMLHELFVKR